MRRNLQGKWRTAVAALSIGFCLFELWVVTFGNLQPLVLRPIYVMTGMVLCFALHSATKSTGVEKKVPIWDIICILLTIICCTWVIANWRRYAFFAIAQSNSIDIVFGIILVLLVIEISRRVTGIVLPLLFLIIVAYGFLGPYMPTIFSHGGLSFRHIMQTLYQSDLGVFGMLVGTTVTMLALFLILGAFLSESGGLSAFVKIGTLVGGRLKGGFGMVAVIGSFLFGIISGSALADTATVGSVSIPGMKRSGFEPEMAAAIQAVASGGGQLSPPVMGLAAFIMAELLGVSYLAICVAAIIPSVLYYASVGVAVYSYSARKGLGAIPREQWPSLKETLTWPSLGPLFVPIVTLVVLLILGFSLQLSGLAACVTALLAYLFADLSPAGMKRRLWRFPKMLERGGLAMADFVPLIVVCGMIVVLIGITGLGANLASSIGVFVGGYAIVALAMTAVICLILGCGVTTVAAYLITLAIAAPALAAMGIQGMPAHFFVFYFAILSLITPPVCPGVLLASAIARSNWLPTSFVAIRIAAPLFILPFAVVFRPTLLMMGGTPLEYVLYTGVALIGVFILGSGFFGYLRGPANVMERIIYVVCGTLMLLPGWQFVAIGLTTVVVVIGIKSLKLGRRLAAARGTTIQR